MSAAELPVPQPSDLSSLWPRALEQLATELPEQQFNTWIRPLPAADVAVIDGATQVSVRVPNRFILDWVRTQYSTRLEAILTELSGGAIRLDLALALRPAAAARTGVVLPARALPANSQALQAAQASAPQTNSLSTGHYSPQQAAPSRGHPQVMGLNPALTFDTLVPGRANQMARTAALHVAGAPGQMYNPLFIYGGVGLGKTHLMNAVGNALLADKPDARILYLHAEQFISDVVKNYQRKTFDELKAKYHQLDLLLIDDVQFFAGKDRTRRILQRL